MIRADSSMHNFARSFGSAIRLRGNVTASLERVSFSDNAIISEPDRLQQYGPDLFVGERSTAVLRNVTTSAVAPAPAPTGAAPPAPVVQRGDERFVVRVPRGGAPVALRDARSTVLADAASDVRVFDASTNVTAPAEVEIGTAPDSVFTADDEWYSRIMAVRPLRPVPLGSAVPCCALRMCCGMATGGCVVPVEPE